MNQNKLAAVLALAAGLAGCASQLPSPGGSKESPRAAPESASGRPAQPRYNLTGYSDAFKSGYVDACANDRRRDEPRFKTDNDYRMGWTDGSAICKRK
jgi:hypothetical protein